MTFADRLQEDARTIRSGPKCLACVALAALNPTDLASYHEATSDPSLARASIARALGVRPNNYSNHVDVGHPEPR